MPDPGRAEGPRTPEAGAVEQAREPFFEVDTPAERVGVVAMGLLALGGVLPWGGEAMWSVGPLQVSALSLVPLTLGFLAALQVLSTAGPVGNVVMLGLASVGSLGAVAAKAGGNLVTHDPWGVGLLVTLLAAALGLAAADLSRREAGLNYVGMATRALELVLQPRVQIALLKLLIPFAMTGLLVFLVLELFGEAVSNKLALIFLTYFFNPIGKEVAIPLALSGAVAPALDPALTWTFIVFIDITTCLFLVWNFDHVLRVPYVGRFFSWVERRGNAMVLKHKWIGRLAFAGLTLYATLPLEGTGAIGGSVVGRAIGLSALRTFLAVGLGSMIRTTVTTLLVLGALSALGL